ncbi:MAG TPA: heterodisulfide reductase subunit A, partial [Desulfovibrio sp.]|nr:heterodisulfide reductase subunit A [Desulfovibrio sp.]
MAEKLGVYICGGCEIGKALDLAGLAEHVKNSKVAPLCKVIKTNPVLCSPEGVAEIEADIKAEGLDGVVVCACSPRVKWDIFRFGDKIQVERVNLREQCVWSFQDDAKVPGLLTLMAQDYVRMGVTRLSKAAIPAPEIPETSKTLMVLGGGFTGMTAALNAAALNRDVILVEKGDKLGGKALNMYKTFPLAAPYDKAQDTGIEKMVAAVSGNPKIKVLLNSTLESLEGAPGLFKATIAGSVYDVGAAILATGWVPGEAKHLEPFGYGTMKNVVTSAQFEEMAKSGKIVRPSDGKPAASVAFVLDMDLALKDVSYDAAAACEPPAPLAGDAPAEGEEKPFVYEQTESAKHLAISSEISSLVALKQAGYVAELNAGAVAMVLYDHMMVPGINE